MLAKAAHDGAANAANNAHEAERMALNMRSAAIARHTKAAAEYD